MDGIVVDAGLMMMGASYYRHRLYSTTTTHTDVKRKSQTERKKENQYFL